MQPNNLAKEVRKLLPGTDCTGRGGCGFATCDECAAAIAEGGPANLCPACKEEDIAAIVALTGGELVPARQETAFIKCSGCAAGKSRLKVYGSCEEAVKSGFADRECVYGCVGAGSCVAACTFGALSIVDGNVQVDKEKCNGCGACAAACHEGAIAMVDGKARLMRDDYCDGLGDCLPACPTGAITFVEREAAAYDEQAVMENKQRKMRKEGMTLPCGCPGSQSRNIQRQDAPAVETPQAQQTSRLSQWPVQIKLVPVNAPYFDGARLLIAADCTAYAYAAFHERFIKGHITLVGCPKLDGVDYSEKLTEIIRENNIKSVTVVRMEVPCCGGLELAAKKALQQSGKFIPWQVVTVTVDGRLKED